jgi:hypothetical protein
MERCIQKTRPKGTSVNGSQATMTTPTLHPLHPKYRADIDSLEAVAVLSVVALHLFQTWPRSGFKAVMLNCSLAEDRQE